MKKRHKRTALWLATVMMAALSFGGSDSWQHGIFSASVYAEEAETDPVVEMPDVQITITGPNGWQKDTARVQISAENSSNSGNFQIAKVEARISENGAWTDITNSMAVEIHENSSVYVRITDQNGQSYTQNKYISCFDQTKPTLSAAAKSGVLVIKGTDEESGVAAIYVNGNEFTELTDNTLNVRLQQADTAYQYFTLQVKDQAGNLSDNYKIPNPYYENPDALKDATVTGTETEAVSSLPMDVSPTEPTSATATVIEHEVTGNETVEEIQIEDTDLESGRVQGIVSESASEGGKEFYTIQTKSDKVFYLIIDKDQATDNVYLLTEVGENDLLNFTDVSTVTLPQNQAVVETALPVTTTEIEEEPETEKVKETEAPAPEPEQKEEPQDNTGTLLMMGLALAGVGVGYYFLKKRKSSFDPDYDEEDEEDYEEEMDMEEDTGSDEEEN